jgi:O-antigen/teichoic acid export membrane protein
LQKQPIASLPGLVTSVSLLIFTYIVRPSTPSLGLILLAVFYVFAVNVPLIVLTFVVFKRDLKNGRPSFRLLDKKKMREVVTLGGFFFAIQLALLVINSSNQFLISNLNGPASVVDYQKYYKVFASITGVASAISMPIWALTAKSYKEKNYSWIAKMAKWCFLILLVFGLGTVVVSLLLQPVFGILYQESSISVSSIKATVFCLWAIATVSSYFVSGIANGIEALRSQLICLSIGAIIKIPIIYYLHSLSSSFSEWTVIIAIDTFILMVSSIVVAFCSYKKIRREKKRNLL